MDFHRLTSSIVAIRKDKSQRKRLTMHPTVHQTITVFVQHSFLKSHDPFADWRGQKGCKQISQLREIMSFAAKLKETAEERWVQKKFPSLYRWTSTGSVPRVVIRKDKSLRERLSMHPAVHQAITVFTVFVLHSYS